MGVPHFTRFLLFHYPGDIKGDVTGDTKKKVMTPIKPLGILGFRKGDKVTLKIVVLLKKRVRYGNTTHILPLLLILYIYNKKCCHLVTLYSQTVGNTRFQ